METQEQQIPQPLQSLSRETPGAIVQTRAIPPELLAQMKADAMPIHQTMPIRPAIAPGQRDWMPLYVGAGLIGTLTICGTIMVAIANTPNAQTERVATAAVQSSALVAKEVAERPTCRAIGLIVMEGACPDPSAGSNEVQPAPVAPASEPLPAALPVATNPYEGLDNADLQMAWNDNGCNANSSTEVCTQILNAAQQ